MKTNVYVREILPLIVSLQHTRDVTPFEPLLKARRIIARGRECGTVRKDQNFDSLLTQEQTECLNCLMTSALKGQRPAG
jgi:hypothetical protein